jgi:hypothetical protein
MLHATLLGSAGLKEVRQVGDQTALRGDEEEARTCKEFLAIKATVS